MGLRNTFGQWSVVTPITEENRANESYLFPIGFPKNISVSFASYTRNYDSISIAAITYLTVSYTLNNYGHLVLGGTLHMIFIGY